MKQDELDQVEQLVNNWIAQAHPINVETMPIDQALAAGALAMFGEKYGEIVRVINVPGVSMELCGGTHVKNTAQLGVFKIISETGIASGIRRIEAVSGPSVLDYLSQRDLVVKQLCDHLKSQPTDILDRVLSLQTEVKELEKNLLSIRKQLAFSKALGFVDKSIAIGDSQFVVERLDGVDGSSLQKAAQSLLDQLGDNAAVVLSGIPDPNIQNKIVFVAAFGPKIVSSGLNAGKFIGDIAKICGGGGGGRPNFAQAGGRDLKSLNHALESAREQLTIALS